MLWVLLWFGLVAAAIACFAYLGLRLFRQLKALTAELSTASQRLGELSAAVADPGPAGTTDLPDRR